MNRFAADWILPISDEPIRGGAVAVDHGRVVEVFQGVPSDAWILGRVAILPGLVNAHTHLELSHLRGKIPPANRFLDWVRPMLAARREHGRPDEPDVLTAARTAIEYVRATGTALVGDVGNTLATLPLLREAGMSAHVFHELIGFSGRAAAEQVEAARALVDASGGGDGQVRVSLAPHAPYSVSPALFSAIRRDLDAHPRAVSSVHLGESPEEIELLGSGSGPWRGLLEELGVWNDSWVAPRCSPVQYLSDLKFLDRSVMVVHGVQFEGDDLARVRAIGSTLVSCPRSNVYVGVGSPPLEAFYAMKVEVALGTDSLASVVDLNLFAELAEARRIAPKVPARTLLRSATLVGARALGFEAEFGSIEPGKRAALLAVDVPEGVIDVEEYLVSGVEPTAVRWLDPAAPDRRAPAPKPS